jgi:hypothetical protein
MNRLWLLPCAALLFVLARDTPKARACGGGALFDPHVVGEPRLLEADDFDTRNEARFLYPFLVAQPKQANLLWEYSYNDLEQIPAPDVTAFDRAVNAHDYPRAEQEAQALVASWYDLPPVLAAPHRPVLLRAVEFLESYPFLSTLSLEQARALPDPHRPTQQFLDLLRQSAQNIPNGWARGAKQSASAGVFGDLLAQTRAWLKANPAHPLRDLVELWQVRLGYFSGDTEAAWASLFQLRARRPVRALAEMRFLVQQGLRPSDAQLERLGDPLLVALFTDAKSAAGPRWQRWWRLSQQANDQSGLALQERLLQVVAESRATGALPKDFPDKAARRSQYWGKLRALALMNHARWQDARAQLLLLAPDPEQANLIARCYVGLGHPELAARVQQLARPELRYVVEVLVSEAELPGLHSANSAAAAEARLAQEIAALGRADIQGAATVIQSVDPEQAAALRGMAAFAQHGDKLGLARAFNQRAQSLGSGEDRDFYRGVSTRYTALDPQSAEARAIAAYFEAGTGAFHALRAYVEWLEANPNAPNARQVLAEADRTYVLLQAYGGWPDLFWERHLTRHDLTLRLRQVGKRLRAKR